MSNGRTDDCVCFSGFPLTGGRRRKAFQKIRDAKHQPITKLPPAAASDRKQLMRVRMQQVAITGPQRRKLLLLLKLSCKLLGFRCNRLLWLSHPAACECVFLFTESRRSLHSTSTSPVRLPPPTPTPALFLPLPPPLPDCTIAFPLTLAAATRL